MIAKIKGKLGLEQIEFYARHGLYEEERKTGGRYLVDVFLEFNVQEKENLENLETDSINYEVIFALVKKEMTEPRLLIETVAKSIGDSILEKFPKVFLLTVKLKKLDLPLGGKIGCSSFELRYEK